MQSLICMIVPFAHTHTHTHTAHRYICTNVHTYIHNCEGVKKAYSLVKNESKQRPPVLFSLISSLDSTDNTLFPHQHHTTLPSPTATATPTTINYFLSMLLEAASSAVGWRSPCSHCCASMCARTNSQCMCMRVHVCMCMSVHVCVGYSACFIHLYLKKRKRRREFRSLALSVTFLQNETVTHTHTKIAHMHMFAYSIYIYCAVYIHAYIYVDVKSVCEWNEMAVVASNPQLLQ